MKKQLTFFISALSIYSTLIGCSKQQPNTSDEAIQENIVESTNQDHSAADTTIEFGSSITVNGTGVTVDENIVTITQGGTYSLSGTLDDGQVIVNAGDLDQVEILLNGVHLTSSTSAPIYVMNADKTTLTLVEGTESVITDAESYVYEDATVDEPNAAIFSKDDLKINGTGSLIVNANYNNGIASKDDLDIKNGDITINAVNNGLKGKDSIEIDNGTFVINSGGDAIKSDNTTDTTKGWITINNGTFNLTATGDGIQAETDLLINGGTFTIETGGGSENSSSKSSSWGVWGIPGHAQTSSSSSEETTSAKALKAGVNLTVEDGSFNIDSSDDSIHTNDSIVINGGTIDITKSYEGLESTTITINDGTIHLIASDDGINAAGGNDGSAMNGRPGQNNFSSTSGMIYFNGGYVYVNASGDGLDANGSIEMSGGTVIVDGPTDGGNGALDYDATFNISGGLLIASGSNAMLQTPSSSSSQNTIVVSSNTSSHTLINIQDSTGTDLITYAPSKSSQVIMISSPEFKTGETYTISTGGTSTGTEIDGLYKGGSYSGGSNVATLTISSSITSNGNLNNGMGGPGGMGRP
ncbi:MAG: carbohydrate-binding domain-containing protein [Turicibacter sp.]